jgi:hypothetical protein
MRRDATRWRGFQEAMRRSRITLLAVALVLAAACSTRGPVDRSVDAAHATNRTIGETAEGATEGPRSAVVSAVTFPVRLIGRGFEALFGP